MESSNTVSALYEMRHAAERKARAEIFAALSDTPETNRALLDASIDLESKTQDAIDLCHEGTCSHPDHQRQVAPATVTDISGRRKQASD